VSGQSSTLEDEHVTLLQNITNTNPVKNPRKPESSTSKTFVNVENFIYQRTTLTNQPT
jgi:hypothetical protein